MTTVHFERMDETATIPIKGSKFSAGYDLFSAENYTIYPWRKVLVSTNIKIKLPEGVYGRIASRSGLSFKHDIEVGAGVIDPDYTGEIKIILRNFSDVQYDIKKNDRVAQLILEKCLINSIDTNERKRNDGGFGSTGY